MEGFLEDMDNLPISSRRVLYNPLGGSFGEDFRITGVGVREAMPPGHWERPAGQDGYLFLHYHGEGDWREHGRIVACPPETTVLWAPRQPQFYGRANRRWCHTWVSFTGPVAAQAVAARARCGWPRCCAWPTPNGCWTTPDSRSPKSPA